MELVLPLEGYEIFEGCGIVLEPLVDEEVDVGCGKEGWNIMLEII